MKKSVFVAALAAVIMGSCGSTKTATDVASLDGEWNIVEVEGNSVKPGDSENVPFLGFKTAENRLYGNTGCNLLTGSIAGNLKKGEIDFSQTGSTRMMCADMKVERMVLDALGKASHFTIDGGKKMTLSDKGGNAVVVLKKK
ncbi:MAG TPA: hypothetical protein DEQ27_00415 [Prevotella sp.]|nr:hypothetical protein [Prevotella sp.]